MSVQVYPTSESDNSCDVTLGRRPGETWVHIIGTNPDMALGVEETIWDQGGDYTFLTADTTLSISSSNAGDTDVDVTIFGSIEGPDGPVEVIRTVNTNGQSQVAITGDFFRVYSAFVSGGTEPLGDLYIAETDTLTGGVPDDVTKIKAKIIQGFNVTQMALYTIPAGKLGIIKISVFIAGKGTEVTFRPTVRLPGGVKLSQVSFPIYQQASTLEVHNVSAPAGSDVEIRGTADNAGSTGAVFFDLKLFDL